jgi:hypothetical protein
MNRKNLKNPAERKVSVNLSLPLYLLDRLDELCGEGGRSTLVANILKREFNIQQ